MAAAARDIRMDSIRTEYDKAQKELDAIKDPSLLGALFGKDKWLAKFADMRHVAADQFRDCCAEDVLNYHKELAQRTGGGSQTSKYYDWIGKLLTPIKSKEWKKAREEGSDAVQITYDLEILQIRLRTRIDIAKIGQQHR